MKIRVLGAHNCESATSRLVSLLIDDVLAIDAGGLTSRLSFAAQRKLKAILLTHHHYDHIRDIPALAMNLYLHSATIDIYSIPSVYQVLATHLLNDEAYPDFFQKPPAKPTLRFTAVAPAQPIQIEGYRITAALVSHSIPAVGYQITSPDGKVVFFTGDTGPGLADCWRQVSPQLLIIEVTASNRHEAFASQSKHLTPSLLKRELDGFRTQKGYLPRVVAIHMNPAEEKAIAAELAETTISPAIPITLANEGMIIHL